jgi:hypothetical protein
MFNCGKTGANNGEAVADAYQQMGDDAPHPK